ncbi:hypothetical protein AVEN_3708-1, partial [Araneus ventricosus]
MKRTCKSLKEDTLTYQMSRSGKISALEPEGSSFDTRFH